MNIELKPCPFCGGEAMFWNDTEGVGEDWRTSEFVYVKCRNCGARTRAEYDNYKPAPINPYRSPNAEKSREEKMQDSLVDSGKREVAKLWNERV